MKVELKRMGVLRTGCILAVCYGIGGLIILPFFAVAALTGKETGPGLCVAFFMILLYPLMGFIGGILMAFIYNIVVTFTGGMQFELDVEPTTPAALSGPIYPNPNPDSAGV